MKPPILMFLLLLLTVAYLLPLTQVLGSVGDSGTMIYGAQRVSEGALPGRDFVEVMGPGSFYWLAILFKLFGTGWQVTRLQLLFTGTATVGLVYSMARKVCNQRSAILLWLFVLVIGMPFWPDTNHHWDSNLFAISTVWCYLRYEKTRHAGWSIAAGGLAALTSCFMQQKGLYLLCALLVLAASRSPRRAPLQIAGSYSALGLAALAFFWRMGALPDLFYANVLFPMRSYAGVNEVPYGQRWWEAAMWPSFHAFGPRWMAFGFVGAALSFAPLLIVVSVPLLAAAAVAACCAGREARQRCLAAPLPVLTVAGSAVWFSEMHRPDIYHLVYGAPILLVAIFGGVAQLPKRAWQNAAAVVLATGLIIFGGLNLMAHVSGSHLLETRRGPVRSAMDDEALSFLCSRVKPRELVFVYPYDPIYYYLADVRNPTRYSILLYGYNTPAQFAEVIGNLEQKKVPWVLWSREVYGDKLRTWFPAYRQPSADKLILENYLETNYVETAVKGGFRILGRREFILAGRK